MKKYWIIGAVVVVVCILAYWFFIRSSSPAYKFITVTQGSVTETVSATGNTTPIKSVSLSFQNSGTIARVNYSLGDYVGAGAVIAELNTANLYATLQQAQANLAVAQANLDAIKAGTRPEQITIDQSTLANAITSAYSVSDGAIHTSVDQFFTNPRTTNATLSFNIPDATLANTVANERIALEPILTSWNTQITSPSFASSDLISAAAQSAQNLTQISAFLNDIAAVLTKAQIVGSISTTVASTYEASISSARTSIAGAQSSLTSAKGVLALAQAGSTPQSIEAQQAQVEQAKAGVASAQANLQNAEIVAPISGVLTRQDAKTGQLASPGVSLISIIGNNGFEVDTGVSDTDVGKLAIGNKVTMTLDAFQGETFDGSVFYIAPAETNTQGVISYLVKISFDKPDPRLKSGLVANIIIQSKKADNVLVLPQYAILQNDLGTFVKKLVGKLATTTPVTLGIQDQNGNVEVRSGVTLGEQVINIGLKQ